MSGAGDPLEDRIRALEDRAEILQLLASYGPACDSLDREALADLFVADGVYEIVGVARYEGADAIASQLCTPMHLGYIERGCGHLVSMPHLVLDGDRAVATGYQGIYVFDAERWVVERLSASRCEFVRTAVGWRISHRINTPLTGSSASRAAIGLAFG